METFVDIISDIGAQISKIKRCRVNQQTLNKPLSIIFLQLIGAYANTQIFICDVQNFSFLYISYYWLN